jgi:NADH dehydrogenase (ubiquinone) flavoprotein 2
MFTLVEVECMAACANAPMCQVDDKDYVTDLTPEKMLAVIDELASKETRSHD